jgi:hypothetical protein
MRITDFSALSIIMDMDNLIMRTAVLAIMVMYTGTADAQGSLRCKGRIVDVGKSAAEVLALCGKPARRIATQVPVRIGVRSGFTRFGGFSTVEQWIYDRGWGKYPAVLHFDDGIIRRVDHLPNRSGD